ncbi:TLD family protein [Trichomonas vaginalis G3]|uniref:Oxidation resistance protein 1 n=1 Tax=Trichomonas vaginalis (strain ATCC PRA-98 / G3) TaxID=412133 RepID=A2G906_TRIV3|nr:negative regulation of peptidyl-cysteine S-nitrosylation [Trichomonas vaginalis G3]EAX86361.1 TLD family protein [Trichomonas vaginalis G3]KAI5539387.1 negative regulation of peptidyl-cysteine S-nitrosylation [Trichomonas vaginalis G3]|eukprot:XP_001299291.1 TLD family protein [Trichomonas vaginalis G3]
MEIDGVVYGDGNEQEEKKISGLFDIDNHQDCPCYAYYTESTLIFEFAAELFDKKPLYHINLLGIIDSSIIPHFSHQNVQNIEEIEADYAAAILIIDFLEDIHDKKSLKTACFTGMRKDLINLREGFILISDLIQKSFNYRIPDISSMNASNKNNDFKKKQYNTFRLIGRSMIFNTYEIDIIRYALPYRERFCTWKLLYSANEDGVSLTSLFSKARKKLHLMLFLIADDQTKYGAFLTQGLKIENEYYGSGEMFVFTAKPYLTLYKWSGKNYNFTTATKTGISIGTGPNGAAIFIGEALEYGFSDPSTTFDSPSLTTAPKVKILNAELWEVRNQNIQAENL